MIRLLYVLGLVLFSFNNQNLFGQAEQSNKEIVIIEKTIDENGNTISTRIERKSGNYSEDEIQKLIEESTGNSPSNFHSDQFQWFDNFRNDSAESGARPSIGVRLNFESGIAKIEEVTPYSGADLAELRKGDQIVSINNVAIGSIEDIQEILETKSTGDQIKLLIIRDGQEYEKNVTLKSGNARFFNFPEWGSLKFFQEGNSLFPENLDSIFQGLLGMDEMLEGFNLREDFISPELNNPAPKKGERPSLGVFLDDSDQQVIIESVVPGSPAEAAGLKAGDSIINLDGQSIESFDDVIQIMNTKRMGDLLEVEINRAGQLQEMSVILS